MTVEELASKAGKARWANVSKEERAAYFSRISGGKRWANATPEMRAEHGRKIREGRAKKQAQTI